MHLRRKIEVNHAQHKYRGGGGGDHKTLKLQPEGGRILSEGKTHKWEEAHSNANREGVVHIEEEDSEGRKGLEEN